MALGGSIAWARKSTGWPRSSTKIWRTKSSRPTLCISGSWYSFSWLSWVWLENIWYATPGRTRPALPRRWFADARLTQASTRLGVPFNSSLWFSFTRPESTTKTTSSMVIEVSAMLVLITILRTPFGGISKTAVCSEDDSDECRGNIKTLGDWKNSFFRASSMAFVISIIPGMKTRIAPSSFVMQMCSRSRASSS